MHTNGQHFSEQQNHNQSIVAKCREDQPIHTLYQHLQFCIVCMDQLTPSCISNGFGKMVVPLAPPAKAGDYVLDGKIFKEYRSVCVHPSLAAQFMGKVFSSVCNALMDMSNDLAAFWRFIFGISSLCPAEFEFITAKEPQIIP